ncbi:hypothetical protein N327_13108, partial [Fulmarus glacialis]
RTQLAHSKVRGGSPTDFNGEEHQVAKIWQNLQVRSPKEGFQMFTTTDSVASPFLLLTQLFSGGEA